MFHVELRRFPNVARAFNLTAEELEHRIVAPWAAGAPVELDDRQWEPARSKLAIYEGPEIPPEERGLGRGWAAVTRTGEDVTARMLERAHDSVERFKAELLAGGRMTLSEVVARATRSHPQTRVSEQLALAEQAVWELLHQGRLALVGPEGTLARERWGPVLLRWESWHEDAVAVEARP
jgi:hypothetical protein